MKCFRVVVCLGMLCVCSQRFGAATPLMNGDFAAGLTGWTSKDHDRLGNVTSPSPALHVAAGLAVLTPPAASEESAPVAFIVLSQSVDIPVVAPTFSFDIAFTRTGGDGPPGAASTVDVFQAAYQDASDLNVDRHFLEANGHGVFDPDTMAPLTLLDLGNGLRRFTTAIADLGGRSGTFTFTLFEEDDGFTPTVQLDNVAIGSNAVPEPATWVLLGSGFLAFVGFTMYRRKHSRQTAGFLR